MTEKYKIIAKFVKDMSSETPDIDTYLFVKDNIKNYSLSIDIKSRALKDKIIQIETTLKYIDKSENKKKSLFEMVFASVIRINDEIKDKKELEKIILCDVQTEIYPDIEKALLDLLHNSGYPGIKFEKKVDFENLYKQRFN